MKRWNFVFVLLIAAAALAACSSGPAPAEFTVEMSEFAFTPNSMEVQVGQEVTIHLKNIGALNHEFMVGREVMMMNGAANTFTHNLFESAEPMVMGGADGHNVADDAAHPEGDMEHGYMVLLERGSEDVTLTFTVTEDMVGEWQIGCFTDGGSHYAQGMSGTFIVRP